MVVRKPTYKKWWLDFQGKVICFLFGGKIYGDELYLASFFGGGDIYIMIRFFSQKWKFSRNERELILEGPSFHCCQGRKSHRLP